MLLLLATGMMATRWPWLLLGAGVLSLSVALLVMTRTHWGQARPLSKCAVLSVWAHLMLLGFASLTNWWVDPPRRPLAQTIRVSWVDSEEVGGEAVEGDDVHGTTLEVESESNADEVPSDASVEERATEDDGAPPLLDAPEPTPEKMAEAPTSDDESDPPADSDAAESNSADQAQDEPNESSEANAADHDRSRQDRSLPPAPPADVRPDETEVAAAETADDTPQSLTADDAADIFEATKVPKSASGEDAALATRERLTPNATVDLSRDRPNEESRPRDLPAIYQGRDPAQRTRLVMQSNGSPDAERSVQAGLDWLAAAQDLRTGRWSTEQWGGGREIREFSDAAGSINADTALTGLALLAFLGSGYTHLEGPYQETVQRGLEFLLSQQSAETGSLAGSAGRYVAMYCHGMASFALSETLVMSGDERLRDPVRRAIGWTVRAQHPTSGGWRYELGDVGDTSQFGWQVMAMVSARAAGIEAPAGAWQRADRWLDRVAMGSYGGLACYVPDQRRATPSMTAEAAACRFFLQSGMRPDAWNEASQMIIAHGPSWQGTLDLYYCYYATLAMYLAQDPKWPAWNERLTRELLRRQQTTGSLAGSWDTRTRWGAVGGRVYTTSMACLCLETCYRYLPVYRVAQSHDAKWRRSDR